MHSLGSGRAESALDELWLQLLLRRTKVSEYCVVVQVL
jgi:hypothetical protein